MFSAVRSCAGFDDADEAEQRRIAAEATEKMKSNGFAAWFPLLLFVFEEKEHADNF